MDTHHSRNPEGHGSDPKGVCSYCHQTISSQRLRRHSHYCSQACQRRNGKARWYAKKGLLRRPSADGICTGCGNTIPAEKMSHRQPGQRAWCSSACRNEWTRKLWQKENAPKKCKIPTGTVGAISELLTAAFLMERGMSVFRAMSPSCPCDLAVLRDGKLLRVEVTTGSRSAAGRVFYPSKDPNKYDILAIVLPDKILIQPEGALGEHI